MVALTLSLLFALATVALAFDWTAIEIERVAAKLRAASGICVPFLCSSPNLAVDGADRRSIPLGLALAFALISCQSRLA